MNNVSNKQFGSQTLLDAFGQKTISKTVFCNKLENSVKYPFIKISNNFTNYKKIIKTASGLSNEEPNHPPIVYCEASLENNGRIILVYTVNQFTINIMLRNNDISHYSESPDKNHKWVVSEGYPCGYPIDLVDKLWEEVDTHISSISAREILSEDSTKTLA